MRERATVATVAAMYETLALHATGDGKINS